jgi:hypothetical protein
MKCLLRRLKISGFLRLSWMFDNTLKRLLNKKIYIFL